MMSLQSIMSLNSHISDTRSQGCTDLPSLVKCVDYRSIVIQYAIKLGWWWLHDVLECMLEAIFTVMVSTTASFRAADKHPKGLLLTLGQSWQSWPADNAYRAKLGGCVSTNSCISKVAWRYPVHGTRFSHHTCWKCCIELCTGHTDDTHILHAMGMMKHTKWW